MMQVRDIFLAAIEIEDLMHRGAYVSEICGEDIGLQQQVNALLAAHDCSGDFLKVPVLQQIAKSQCPQPHNEHEDRTEGRLDLSFLQPSTKPESLGRLLHYEILELVGQGGCGIVFKAFDEKLHRVVAVKTMTAQLAATSPARKRFLREARTTAAIRHDNVVSIYAVEEMPIPFLVMEFVDGQTLQDKVSESGPFDLLEIVSIGRQIAGGLEAAHAQGLIHRDIKPENILLEKGTGRPKITDFGLARAVDDASLTQSGAVFGTPLYMSPEQAQGCSVDHRSDLFSLGSVLYLMSCGRPPFRASTSMAVLRRVVEDQPRPLQEVIPEIPDWLAALIAKLHAKRPQDRFATANELSELLARCFAQRQQAGDVKMPPELQPWAVCATKGKTWPLRKTQPILPVSILPSRRFNRRWGEGAALCVLLLLGLGAMEATGLTNMQGTVIRFLSSDGTLVIEIEDQNLSVSIDDRVIVINGAGPKEIRLRPGNHRLLARKEGRVVHDESITVSTGGRQVLRITQEAPLVKEKVETAPEPDREAATWVRSIGGGVILLVNGQFVVKPSELPNDDFRLSGVSLYQNQQVDDAGMALLSRCRRIDNVNLDRSSATNAMLRHFEGHPTMGGLLFRYSKITGEGLKYFHNNRQIFWLEMFGASVTDADLAPLHFERLGRLDLRENPITDRTMEKLAAATKLEYVTLDQTHISSDGVKHLIGCTMLKELWLYGTMIDDTAIPALSHLTTLQKLGVKNTHVTEHGITQLHEALPQCRIEWNGGVIEPKNP